MVGSSVASPLCTWLVAACMSVACENDQMTKSPSLFQSPKRLSRSARRKKLVTQSGYLGFMENHSSGLMSSLNGSGIQAMMSSCLAFEPCEEYNSSKGLYSSLGNFPYNGFSLFGLKTSPITRRQRRMSRVAHTGNVHLVLELICYLAL